MSRRMFTVIAILAAMLFVTGGFGPGAVQASVASVKSTLSKQIKGNGGMSANVKSFVESVLLKTISHPILVEAVEQQNAKGTSLAEIQRIDKEWKAAEEPLPIQDEKMGNTCANELVKIIKSNGSLVEVFVTDNQGANVCQNTLTSDYWQGDEAKWKNSFNGGKGGIDVGKVKFDKSANAQLQQVSLPILDKSGKVIGAITFGLDVGRV